MSDSNQPVNPNLGVSRRDLLKRGAVVGAVVWAAPVVQSLSSPAFAQAAGGSPLCDFDIFIDPDGTGPNPPVLSMTCPTSRPACCACLETNPNNPFACIITGACTLDDCVPVTP